MDAAAAIAVIEALPVDERMEIACRLWDGAVEDGWRPKPSEALLAELRRRLAAYDADPTSGLTWEQMVASIKRSS
ncbi:MAG: addiction module protein [Gemmataceae bacterium]